MAAGNARVSDPLDTVHHEMDSMVCGNYVKSVWLPVIEQFILEQEATYLCDEFALAMIKDSQIVHHILKKYSQII